MKVGPNDTSTGINFGLGMGIHGWRKKKVRNMNNTDSRKVSVKNSRSLNYYFNVVVTII